MKPDSNHGACNSGKGRAMPAAPWSDDDVASLLSQTGEERPHQPTSGCTRVPLTRESPGDLFSDDPPRQFAALKELATRPELEARQYDRIETIRDETRHLLIAELAEKILRQRGHSTGRVFSKEAYGEVAALLQQEEAMQQEKRRKGKKEETPIEIGPAAAARWLVTTALTGLLLGIAMTWGLMPRPASVHAQSAEAYLDGRTGKPILPNSDAWRDAVRRGDLSELEPAFYCWNCKKWLPVQNSQKNPSPVLGPAQALADRPLAGNRPAAMPARRKP